MVVVARARAARAVGEEPDPRFSFANERTFLAWIRTALALIAGGLAVTQILPPFDVPGGRRILGLPLLVVGGIVSLRSYRRWEASERAIRLREPLPASDMLEALALVVAVLAVLAVGLVLFE
jgi:putative membrane protein